MRGFSEISEACSNGGDEDFRQTTTRPSKSKWGMSGVEVISGSYFHNFTGYKFQVNASRGSYFKVVTLK